MTSLLYIERKSTIHKIDPRAKLLFAPLFSISLFFVDNAFILALLFILFALFSLDAMGLKAFSKTMLLIAPIVLLLFLMSPLEERGGVPLLEIGSLVILTHEAIDKVLIVSLRFILISLAFAILIRSVKERDIIKSLRWFRLPYSSCLCLSLIFRFIPYVASLYESIRMSLSMRLREGKRGYKAIPFLIALIINSFKMVPSFSSSLEERGFGRNGRREAKMGFSLLSGVEVVLSVTIPVLIVIFL